MIKKQNWKWIILLKVKRRNNWIIKKCIQKTVKHLRWSILSAIANNWKYIKWRYMEDIQSIQVPFTHGTICRNSMSIFCSINWGCQCCSLLIKLQAWGFAVLLRGDFSTGVFPGDLWNFWEHLFWWASGNGSFWFSKFWHITRLFFTFSFFSS